jgi:2-polyprenyl-3-methyl-5-hydroxy-6-metoxy-1,4-benzoquinol methylase
MKSKTRCNLCGSERFSTFHNIQKGSRKFTVTKCIKCGLVFLHPRPSEKEIAELYDESYFHGRGFDAGVNYVSGLKKREQWDIILNNRLSRIEQMADKGVILDIGCGLGELLNVAKDRGWCAQGVELSEFAFKMAKKTFGLKVFNGTFEQADFSGNSFDVITMIEVIEHLPDPMKTLKECHRVLKTNGIIIVQTGDVSSYYARISGNRWPYFLAGHLFYFSKKTIRKMLEKTGFEIIKIYRGDEISFRSKSSSFWSERSKKNIRNLAAFLRLIITDAIRKSGFGGMTVYAKKV